MAVQADMAGRPAAPATRLTAVMALSLLIVLVLVGLGFHRDYGMSWDEPVQREYGGKVYRYVTDGDEGLLADRHRVYGPAFEVLLYSLEESLGLEDARDIYFMRHLVTFLVFAVGVVFFFLLAGRLLGDLRLALLGSVFFMLTPRIFAHAFYNSKDIPFMAVFTVCMYTLLLYLDRPGLWTSAVHGACCAVLVDLRIMGVFIPLITLGFFVRDMAVAGKDAGSVARRGRRAPAFNFGVFCAAFVPLVVLMWPTLWASPLRNFIAAFGAMRKFAWGATVLFMGEKVRSTDLPPHYTLVWMVITLPLTYIGLSVAGLIAALRRLAGRSIGLAVARRDALLVLIWLAVPLAFLVVSGAVLYDTWRHTFFLYPAVLLLALMGLGWLLNALRPRGAVLVLAIAVAVNLAATVSFMARSHPHQNVYFNSIVGGPKGAEGKYEMDYWGLSYRALLEALLDKDGRAALSVHSLNEPGYYNSFLLEPAERVRITYLENLAGADYYLTNFRWDRLTPPEEAEFVSIKVGGANLSAAYRTR